MPYARVHGLCCVRCCSLGSCSPSGSFPSTGGFRRGALGCWLRCRSSQTPSRAQRAPYALQRLSADLPPGAPPSVPPSSLVGDSLGGWALTAASDPTSTSAGMPRSRCAAPATSVLRCGVVRWRERGPRPDGHSGRCVAVDEVRHQLSTPRSSIAVPMFATVSVVVRQDGSHGRRSTR